MTTMTDGLLKKKQPTLNNNSSKQEPNTKSTASLFVPMSGKKQLSTAYSEYFKQKYGHMTDTEFQDWLEK